MLTPQEKDLKSEVIKELASRRTNEKYRYYEPIGKVEEYLDLLGRGDLFVTLLSAANGIGKTTAMVNFLSHLFWPCGNKYFQQPLLKNWPFDIKDGRIASDPTTIEKTITPMLEEWFPKGRYTNKHKRKSYPSEWKTDNGWSFDIMTYEQSVKEYESATLSFVMFDEPPPNAIFKATVARMRKGGIISIWATPLTGSAWMYDEIIANPNPESQYRGFIEAEVEDACKIHGVRGFLEHEDIVKMVSQYDPEDMQARVFGKFQHLIGLVFKKFRRDIHVIDTPEINMQDYVVVQCYDTHPRVNEAVLWVAFDRKGRAFVVDELWTNVPTGELVKMIKEKDAQYRVVKRYLDPSAFNVDKRKGGSYAATLSNKYGLVYEPGSKRREDARKLIRDRLHYRIAGDEYVQAPMIYFSNTCPRSIWEMEHWQWDDWRGKAAERKDPKATPQDKNDHQIENLGRALLDAPVFTDMVDPTVASSRVTVINDDPFA